MPDFSFKKPLNGRRVHFVGAKGTGMAALAEIFAAKGARLSGSDVPDTFYTDAILDSIHMRVFAGFDSARIDQNIELVVFSDAYNLKTNPELLKAAELGIPLCSFAQALGALSETFDSSSVAGVHGKTTTTAMVGTLLHALGCPATVLTGSAVASFGDRCTIIDGNDYLVAETDEYRRHFLHYRPRRILLTSVESDHQDYYPTYEAIRAAYEEFTASLPSGGMLIFCADDPGAVEVATALECSRKDVVLVPYGFSAQGRWKILSMDAAEGETCFQIAGLCDSFSLHVPGRHLVLDAVGALALTEAIMRDYFMRKGEGEPKDSYWKSAARALSAFAGSRRRSEIIGSASGILVMDDYAHHPTALKATISGLRSFWPSRRLIVDFMSHTYSRTIALMDEFAGSFDEADCIVLHGIYASAREIPVPGISGMELFEKVRLRRPDLLPLDETKSFLIDKMGSVDKTNASIATKPNFILYSEKHADAANLILPMLRPNDLFITMGAGDNWKLGRTILSLLKNREEKGKNL
jgi:UDP-N-acetylmuramate--alanine ligase